MKIIELTQNNGMKFYLNASCIILYKESDRGGSELLVQGNSVTIYVQETPNDIITLINQ